MRFSGIRTPLAKAKGEGAAHQGSHHWINQRLTAIANVPLVIWFIVSVVCLSGKEHYELMQFFDSPVNATLMALFIISTFMHAALGLQVVIEDYVHTKVKKVALLVLVKLGFFALGAASLLAIAKLHFSG
jgi:succinate dehydrogenase / fumarate reductase membrane anchor subunit